MKFDKCGAVGRKAEETLDHFVGGEDRLRVAAKVALQTFTAQEQDRALKANRLMERIVMPSNVQEACIRVIQNKGAPGIDDMPVTEIEAWFALHGQKLAEQLLAGTYEPQPVKCVTIPKPAGGLRELGIPRVIDRVVQQAMLIVLNGIINPTFSTFSYGFRPGIGAHDALKQAREYVKDGRVFVVDIDLEKFFDRVNHDVLMALVARRIDDKRVLRLIRAYLSAGIVLPNGLQIRSDTGTPQGGPLSPLLANIMLDDLDKELEKRGHKFCRYADDCNIYVRSQAAGERVFASITAFLEKKLRLKVNTTKSAVALVNTRKFLGYTISLYGSFYIARQSIAQLKAKIRNITKRNRGVAISEVVEELNLRTPRWVRYFRFAECKKALEDLDAWIRRKLRCIRLKQCKKSFAIAKLLISRGLEPWQAWILAGSGKGWWRLAGSPQAHRALSNAWFDEIGLKSLSFTYKMVYQSL